MTTRWSRILFERVDARLEARTIFSIALTVLGLSSMLGRCSGSPLLSAAGRMFLFAPQPVVFADQNISAEVKLEVHLPSGIRPLFGLDRAMRARFEGSLHRVDTYGHALLAARAVPLAVRTQILSFGLCNSGPLVRELELPGGALRYWIYVRYRSRPSVRPEIVSVSCDASPTR